MNVFYVTMKSVSITFLKPFGTITLEGVWKREPGWKQEGHERGLRYKHETAVTADRSPGSRLRIISIQRQG